MLRQRKSILRLVVFYISVISLLAVIVLSCNQSKPSDTYYGEVARVISGKIQNYTASEVKLVATPLSGYAVIGTGHIDTDANFKFSYQKLEHIIEDFAFSPITDLACAAIIPDGQETTQFILTGDIQIAQNSYEFSRELLVLSSRQVSYPGFRFKVNDYAVGRIGVDKDITIKGSCKSEFFESVYLELNGDFDLELKEGWNIVVLTVTDVDQEGLLTTFRLETKPVPSDALWWYLELPD